MSSDNIQRTAARGVLWTGMGQATKQGMTIITSVLLARLLSPDDFGLFGMTGVFVALAQILTDFGFGSAIVQKQENDPTMLATCFWINLGIAVICAALLAALSPLIADFFVRPELVSLTIALAINVIISGMLVVPQAILSRDLRFVSITKAQIAGSLTGSVAAIALAFLGAGVWSLVFQPMIGSLITLAMLFVASKWRPVRKASWSSVKGIVGFSSNLLGSSILGFAKGNIDTIILGRTLGSSPLGFYSMALLVTYFPIIQISVVMIRVLFPTLSRLQNDLAQFRKGYLKAVSAIAIVTFPMLVGLFSVAPDFVDVVLGEQWRPVTTCLQILCGVALVQSVAATAGTVLLSMGASRTVFRLSLGTVLVSPIGTLIGVQWGITGVAIASACVGIPVYALNIHFALEKAAIPVRAFVGAVGPSFASSLLMLAAVVLVQQFLGGFSGTIRLPISIVVGAMAYVLATLVINRDSAFELLNLARSSVRRG